MLGVSFIVFAQTCDQTPQWEIGEPWTGRAGSTGKCWTIQCVDSVAGLSLMFWLVLLRLLLVCLLFFYLLLFLALPGRWGNEIFQLFTSLCESCLDDISSLCQVHSQKKQKPLGPDFGTRTCTVVFISGLCLKVEKCFSRLILVF